MVSKRFRSFTHNYKKVIITTPDKEGDPVHRAFTAGHQAHWEVPCPKCGICHEMVWGDEKTVGGLKWTKNEETYDEEKKSYRYEKLKATMRYHCWNPECDHVWRDIGTDRKYISTEGAWVERNPDAPSNTKSYTWNALLPWWPSWYDQMVEFLQATKAKQWGDFYPLKDHMNETRGEVWTDQLRYGDDDKYLMARVADYDPCEVWDLETRRFMSVDVQGAGGRHFWYVIRAWAPGGKSRLLAYGKAWSWEELASKAEEWGVGGDNMVIDSGQWAPEVYQKVIDSGYRWKPMKGDAKDGFRIHGKMWLYQKTLVDPTLGKVRDRKLRDIELYMWAKYGVIERLHAMLHGIVGQWEIFPGTGEDYNLQVPVWDKRSRIMRQGGEMLEWFQKRKEDHLSDCEQMQIVAAAATGMLHMPEDLELWKASQKQPPN
jgi:hypothetical protein